MLGKASAKTLENPKSMKIELWGLSSPSKKQLQSHSALEDAFEPLCFPKISDFWMIFEPQNGSEIVKKRIKIYVQKKHIFRIDFLSNFLRFGLQKWSQNQWFFEPFSKTSILWKSCSRRGGSSIFKVRSFKKSSKNRCQNAIKRNIEKKLEKIEF